MRETQKFTESFELRVAALVAAGLVLAVCANKPVAADQSSELHAANGSIYRNPPQPPKYDISSDVLIAPPPRFQLPRV